MRKGELAKKLSEFEGFSVLKVSLEQYTTPSELAAELLWNALMQGDIENKDVADFGAGTGILGLGTMILGAKSVYLIEKDLSAIETIQKNIDRLKSEITGKIEVINKDITGFSKKINTIIMNPPFGTKQKHADKAFLEQAFKCAPVIYTIHKTSTENFINKITDDNNYQITHQWKYTLQLKASYKFHKKPAKNVQITIFRLEKKN